MAKQFKSIKNRPIRTVEYGAGWHIDYSPADQEYTVVVNEVGVVGRGDTKDAALDELYDWMDQQVAA